MNYVTGANTWQKLRSELPLFYVHFTKNNEIFKNTQCCAFDKVWNLTGLITFIKRKQEDKQQVHK